MNIINLRRQTELYNCTRGRSLLRHVLRSEGDAGWRAGWLAPVSTRRRWRESRLEKRKRRMWMRSSRYHTITWNTLCTFLPRNNSVFTLCAYLWRFFQCSFVKAKLFFSSMPIQPPPTTPPLRIYIEQMLLYIRGTDDDLSEYSLNNSIPSDSEWGSGWTSRPLDRRLLELRYIPVLLIHPHIHTIQKNWVARAKGLIMFVL